METRRSSEPTGGKLAHWGSSPGSPWISSFASPVYKRASKDLLWTVTQRGLRVAVNRDSLVHEAPHRWKQVCIFTAP